MPSVRQGNKRERTQYPFLICKEYKQFIGNLTFNSIKKSIQKHNIQSQSEKDVLPQARGHVLQAFFSHTSMWLMFMQVGLAPSPWACDCQLREKEDDGFLPWEMAEKPFHPSLLQPPNPSVPFKHLSVTNIPVYPPKNSLFPSIFMF